LRRWPGTKGFYPFTEPPVLRVAATRYPISCYMNGAEQNDWFRKYGVLAQKHCKWSYFQYN
jgi:hypothetical protein